MLEAALREHFTVLRGRKANTCVWDLYTTISSLEMDPSNYSNSVELTDILGTKPHIAGGEHLGRLK